MAKKNEKEKKIISQKKKNGKKNNSSLKQAAPKKMKAPKKPVQTAAAVKQGPVKTEGMSAASAAMPEKREESKSRTGFFENKKLAVFLIIILSLGIYLNTFRNQFLYDDSTFIQENNSIRSLDNISSFFNSVKSFSAKGEFLIYRPLPTITFAVDYKLWGLKPGPFHIQNILFHAINGILVYFLVLLLTSNLPTALFTALLFTAHPVQTEAVAWIAGRSSVMVFTFFLLALICYIESHKWQGAKRMTCIFISMVSYTLSLSSKEMAVTLPVILITCDFYFTDKERFKNVLRNSLSYIAFGLITIGYIYQRYIVLHGLSGQKEYIGGSLASALLTMSKGVAYYVKLLLYPVKLSAEYIFPVSKNILDKPVILSLCVIILMIIAIVALFRKNRVASFAIAWFFITLIPVYNIVPLQDVTIAERFLYMPSLGFCILAGLLISSMYNSKDNKVIKIFGAALIILLVILYSVRSIYRNADWRDEFSFWTATKKTTPNSYRAYGGLGIVYDSNNNIDEAIRNYEISLSLFPGNILTRNNLAISYAKKGWYEKATKEFKDILAKDPNDSSTLTNLGLVYARTGLYNDAIREFEKAIKANPSNSTADNNLGLVYEAKGMDSIALKHYMSALEKDSGNEDALINYNRIAKKLNERKMINY